MMFVLALPKDHQFVSKTLINIPLEVVQKISTIKLRFALNHKESTQTAGVGVC